MCGIAGIYFKNNQYSTGLRNRMLDELLLGVEARGRQATGFLALAPKDHENHLVLDKAAAIATDFIKARKKFGKEARIIIGHTRYATKGSVQQPVNNHPVNSGSVYVTHNGVVYNDDELFKSEKLPRAGEVDSEIIAALLNHHGLTPEGVKKALEKLAGSFTIAAVSSNAPGLLVLAAKDNPLVVHINDNFIAWASTETALEKMQKSCFYVDKETKATGELPKWWAGSLTRLTTGDVMQVLDGRVNITTFTPRSYASQYTYTGNTGPRIMGPSKGGWTSGIFRKLVDESATSGNSIVLAREFKDRSDDEKKLTFYLCFTCNRSVQEAYLVNSPLGRMCWDCELLMAEGHRPDVKFNTTKLLDIDQRVVTENGDAIAGAHDEALEALGYKYGIDAHSINWLLFVADTSLFNVYPAISRFREALRSEYWYNLMDAWGDTAAEDIKAMAISGKVVGEDAPSCSFPSHTVPAPANKLLELPTGSTRLPANILGIKVFEDDCYYKNCTMETVAMQPHTGKRYCHNHARGSKGLVFDIRKGKAEVTV